MRLAGARSELSVAEANLKASRAIYRQVIGEDPTRLHPGQPIDRLASVASFFVSRVDTKVDPVLDARGGLESLRGTAAIANACVAYAAFMSWPIARRNWWPRSLKRPGCCRDRCSLACPKLGLHAVSGYRQAFMFLFLPVLRGFSEEN